MDNHLLNELNNSQQQAVTWCEGPQLVIAGAGSGKTRVLTYKIAYLLEEHQLEPWRILALTFTNKAAREMKERIGRLVGQQRAKYLQMGTFHSVFAHILRREAQHIGYNSDFTIYDQSDARSLVKSIIKEMSLDDKQYKASSVADRISMAKNHLLLPHAYARSSAAADDAIRKMSAISDIYMRYTERCRQANAMDFDDLLVQTYMLFHEHEDVRKQYAERFAYVLVDEYQDTNYVQQAIVWQLTMERQKVCVVGDDAQSIYSFRGANIDNILNFQKTYSGARLFKLEQNYRSTQLIVQAANSLIRHNQRQIPKDVYSRNEEGEKLVLKPAYSDKEEAQIVCNDIQRIRRSDKCEYSDFAILYRTNSQSRSFEEYMRKENIPYRIYGGLSFYQRKEIKDVIAYFRVVVNPNDEEALKRIINYPTRGIGDTTVTKIVQAANMHGVSLWTVIKQPAVYHLDVNRGTMTKLLAFKQLIDGWIERAKDEDAYTLGHDIITQSGVSKDIYSGKEPEDLSRQENLEEFVGGLQDFVATRREEDMGDAVALTDFLQEVSLLTDLDSDDDDTQPKVVLMTIHSAKGLEFPNVFIVGLEENIFPSPLSVNSLRELEEERRLLYVAITRAEKRCIMTCAQNRWRYGRMEMDTPSRFIKDIDPQLMRIEQNGIPVGRQTFSNRLSPDFDHNGNRFGRASQYVQNARPVATQFKADPKPRIVAPTPSNFKPLKSVDTPSSTFNAQSSTLREGSVIEHQRFGIGEVIKIEGTGENMKATVRFKNTGTKQLLLKFARFTVVE
ncbi:MAG: UvrD-helicase domain-containing protein [Prevotella sp.]|nr:UvrD-helicase domain-containing protein [Prevotella sp.]